MAYTQGGLAKQTPDTGFQCLNLPATLVLFCSSLKWFTNQIVLPPYSYTEESSSASSACRNSNSGSHRNHLPQAPWCVYVLHNHCCSHHHHHYEHHSIDQTGTTYCSPPGVPRYHKTINVMVSAIIVNFELLLCCCTFQEHHRYLWACSETNLAFIFVFDVGHR